MDPNGPSAAVLPDARTEPYDDELIASLVDADSFTEYKKGYGKTLVCGYARIDELERGHCGQPTKFGQEQKDGLQFGGVIYSDSGQSRPLHRHVQPEAKRTLVFLQDVTGFMVSPLEHGGIIKDGAKMVNAVANSVVPKFTVIVGNSYGAGIRRCAARPTIPVSLWHGRPRALP